MRLLSFAIALAATAASLHAQDDTLHVLRHAPSDTASVNSVITVTFDRPVAGALDATVAAEKLFRIVPAISGRVAWRDPVTIRFVPDEPLVPGTRFTVTIDTAFRALDGTRLTRPYEFSFRVPDARLLARSFGGDYRYSPAMLPYDGKMTLLYSAPVDLAMLQRGVRLEFKDCPAARAAVPLRVARQRPIGEGDPQRFSYAGGWDRDTVADRFRRVVEIEPVSPLPEDCLGTLTLPNSIDDAGHGSTEQYAVRTLPPFALSAFECPEARWCNLEMLSFTFTADVKLADVKRFVHVTPAVPFDFRYPRDQASTWTILAPLVPRTTYAISIDSALRDVDGRRITGKLSATFTTGDYVANIGYASGPVTVPRGGPHTIALRHMNVGAVRVTSWFIPEANRAIALSLLPGDLSRKIDSLAESTTTATIRLHATVNVDGVTELPLPGALLARRDGLVAMRVEVAGRLSTPRPPSPPQVKRGKGTLSTAIIEGEPLAPIPMSPIALVQLTGLAVHARIGDGDGSVVVTSIGDARPVRGATVRYLAPGGVVIAEARTDSAGVATLAYPRLDADRRQFGGMSEARYHLVDAAVAGDRAALPVVRGRSYYWMSNPLDPWSLGGRREGSPAFTATIFAERGIYRPGEPVYLKGVLRTGVLGALTVPPRQPVRLTVTYRPSGYESDEDVIVRDTVIRSTSFGTITDSLRLRPGAGLGMYVANLMTGGPGKWTSVASEELRVAEYRAPEFLVTASSDSAPRFAGDTVHVAVSARYLFGAPMGRTPLRWQAELHELKPWDIRIPGADGWTVGEWDWQWGDNPPTPNVQGVDTLDDAGRADVRVALAALRPSRPGRVDVNVAVTDLNQQLVTSTTRVAIHPAHLYILAKKAERAWYWIAGQPATLQLKTVSPEGDAISGSVITATVAWRQWRRLNGGSSWRDSTVRVDTVRAGVAPATYSFTPGHDGFYEVRLTASDGRGGVARTTVGGYAIEGGRRGGPPYQLALIASAREASVGEEVQVAFDSPFDSAQGWVTLERERVLEQHRLTIHRGMNTIPVRITGAHVPNVFVSVMLLAIRPTRDAHPDSATRLLRAGYVEIAVRTGPKRLMVAVAPRSTEYAPRDSAVVRVSVSDSAHRGVRSEVTLWAVDDGVLALTGYTAPDLIARMYERRGLGAALWSTLPTVGIALPALGALASPASFSLRGQSSRMQLDEVVVAQAFGAAAPAMRTQFRATAFYLGSTVTSDKGIAELRAQLPDNLTTWRMMAVAVGSDDRFGSGDTTMLVTRQIVARPSLPRFVRAADTLVAGAVINARDGAVHHVTVDASSEGMSLQRGSRRTVDLAEGRGATARFAFAVPARDSAPDTVVVRLRASDSRNGDAVESRLPVEPDFHPRAHASIGTLRGRAEVVLDLPADIDAARSTVSLRIGTSPIVPLLAAWDRLRVYPYDCTEQLATAGRAVIAIWRIAGDNAPATSGSDPRSLAQQAADAIVRRQRPDGGFRYWEDHDWTSPWLTAYAGLFLLDARDQGITVDSTVLRRATSYLEGAAKLPVDTGGMNRTERRDRRLALGGRVAIVDFLRRSGQPNAKAEDALLGAAPAMTWEDRLRLAEVLSRRRDARARAQAMVDEAWRAVTRAGARVDLPDSAHAEREFPSRIAPAAGLLTATIALRPDHQLLGGLVETVLQQGRAEGGWAWNTQDYASVVMAMSTLAPANTQGGRVTATAGGRALVARRVGSSDSSEKVPLGGLLTSAPNGRQRLALRLEASGTKMPVFYAVTIEEVPSKPPVTPDIQGIVVERWYERFDNGQPVTAVTEGDLVRVRLRVTVPADREFVAVEDPLPAGLEPVDLTLKTSGTLQPFVTPVSEQARRDGDRDSESSTWQAWLYGRWEDGWWSPWEHKAIHDDKVVWFARMLWPGSYSASYIARATTTGSFVRPPAHAEEMYNPALQGRSDGGRFVVDEVKH